MISDNSSDNQSEQRDKYLQPVTSDEILKRLFHEENSEEKLNRLNDDWSRAEFSTRTDAVRRVIYDLSWYADHDPETVLEILEGRDLYQNWDQGEREVRMFIEVSKVEDQGYYSLYPEEVDESNINEESESSKSKERNSGKGGSPQDVDSASSDVPTSEYEQRKQEFKRDLLSR